MLPPILVFRLMVYLHFRNYAKQPIEGKRGTSSPVPRLKSPVNRSYARSAKFSPLLAMTCLYQ